MKIERSFTSEIAFGAYNAAVAHAKELGFSAGSMSSPFPTALMRGDVLIANWKNLTKTERAAVHGTIDGDFRDGPVKLTIFNARQPLPGSREPSATTGD